MAQSTTADSKEIAFFNARAAKWWSDDGPFSLLLTYNTVRVPFIEKQTATISEGPDRRARVLDVGAGGGLLSEALAKKGYSVLGIDLAEDSIETAKAHREAEIRSNDVGALSLLEYRTADIEVIRDEVAPIFPDRSIPESEDKRFDVVVASEVIEHVDNPEVFLKACAECVKPGGALVVTTPAKTWLSWFILIFLGEYIFGFIPQGTHHYSKFVSRHEMICLGKDHGLEPIAFTGCMYLPFIRKWMTEPTGWVMQMIAFRKTMTSKK